MTLSIEDRIEIILLASNRRSHREIANEFQKLHLDRIPISHTTVGNLITKFKQTGGVFDRSCLIPRNSDNRNVSTILQNCIRSHTNCEPRTACEMSESRIQAHNMTQAPKGCRYVVVQIDENMTDKLHDVLVTNGFHDFVFLTNFPDHSDSMVSYPAEQLLAVSKGPDSHQTSTSSEHLFTNIKQEPDDVPFLYEFPAADLLGTTDVEDGKDQSSSAEGTSHSSLKEYFDKNCVTVPFTWDHEYTLDDADSDSDISAIRGRQCEKRYISCQLCKSMVMVTRYSNLSSHARGHAYIKKYKCAHCTVQHNEYSKVRAHMDVVHGDTISAVSNNTSWETQKVWDTLVQKCFPSHIPTSSEGKSTGEENGGKSTWNFTSATFVCPLCGMRNSDKVLVHSHISEYHAEVDPTTIVISECVSPSYRAESSSLSPEQSISVDVKDENWVTVNHGKSLSESLDNMTRGGDRSSKQALNISSDNEDYSESDSMQCRLCNRSVVLATLADVVEHAKEHYHVKEFECELCGFGSSKRSVVRSHVFYQHLQDCPRIVKHEDQNIRKAWTQVARTCFPNLPRKLMREKVKYLRSLPSSQSVLEATPTNDVLKNGC